jgi:hypothetical protein
MNTVMLELRSLTEPGSERGLPGLAGAGFGAGLKRHESGNGFRMEA